MIRRGFAALAAPLLALSGAHALAVDPAADAAAEPSWIAPLASKSLLLDLARAGSRVFAVGERGHVLYSDDEGDTWTQVQVPVSANLTAVYFLDDRLGWAVGHDEVILRTVDGGMTWERVRFEPEAKQPLLDVWFADALRGLAIGAYGAIYASEDGGATWAQVPFEPAPLEGAASPEPVDEGLYDEADVAIDFHLNAIVPGPGGRLYLAAEAGQLFRSEDLGATWKELPSPYDGSFYGLLPLDGETLLAYGLRGHVFRSEDAGDTWTQIETGTVALLHSATRTGPGAIVIAGTTGVLLTSTDDGRSFGFSQQDDRKGFSAVLAGRDGGLIVAGESGVRRLPLPAAR